LTFGGTIGAVVCHWFASLLLELIAEFIARHRPWVTTMAVGHGFPDLVLTLRAEPADIIRVRFSCDVARPVVAFAIDVSQAAVVSLELFLQCLPDVFYQRSRAHGSFELIKYPLGCVVSGFSDGFTVGSGKQSNVDAGILK
jgi:hypothetical protein